MVTILTLGALEAEGFGETNADFVFFNLRPMLTFEDNEDNEIIWTFIRPDREGLVGVPHVLVYCTPEAVQVNTPFTKQIGFTVFFEVLEPGEPDPINLLTEDDFFDFDPVATDIAPVPFTRSLIVVDIPIDFDPMDVIPGTYMRMKLKRDNSIANNVVGRVSVLFVEIVVV